MKTIRFYFCIFTLCCSHSLFAQEESGNGMLFPQFEQGVVVLKNGVRSSASLNYNMLQQEMRFLSADSTMMTLANPSEVIVVIIGDRRFFPGSSNGSFYEEIQAGKGSFFVQRSANVISQGKASAYGGYSQTAAITSYDSYRSNGGTYKLNSDEKFKINVNSLYYLKSGNGYKKFYSAKALGKLFKNHEADIESFAKENATDFSKIDDIAKIVEYGYSLVDNK